MERQPMNLSESQSRALARLEEEAQVDRGTWDELAGTPRFLRGKLLAEVGEDPQEIVQEFLQRYGDLFGIKSKDEYEILSIKQDTLGNQHVRVSRVQGSYRVYPSRLSFWIDPGSVLIRVKAHWPAVPDIRDQTPTVELDQAQEAAAKERPEDKFVGVVGEPRLEYHLFVREQEWQTDLAWNFVARFEGGHPDTEGFVVSATQGTVLLRYPDEDEVATTTTGIGINNADETAMTPVRTINVDDPGGGANLRLLDTSRSVDRFARMMTATGNSITSPTLPATTATGPRWTPTTTPGSCTTTLLEPLR
jgi:Zn-dependent metalloprotease